MTDSTDSPTAHAPEPPGDFTTSSFFTSPSTYLTLATYALPLLNLLFSRDVSEEAQAVANLAPIVATGVLLLMRSRAKQTVVQANLELAKLRQHYSPRDGNLEDRMDQLEKAVASMRATLEDWEDEAAAEEQLQEQLERKVVSDDVTVVMHQPRADKFLFNGELVEVPRTKTGKIDGRTVVGKAALAAGIR